jgi:hypothetical protein
LWEFGFLNFSFSGCARGGAQPRVAVGRALAPCLFVVAMYGCVPLGACNVFLLVAGA